MQCFETKIVQGGIKCGLFPVILIIKEADR